MSNELEISIYWQMKLSNRKTYEFMVEKESVLGELIGHGAECIDGQLAARGGAVTNPLRGSCRELCP